VEFRRGHANYAALEAGSNDSQDWVESSLFCFLQTYSTNAQTQRREALGQVQDAVVSHGLVGLTGITRQLAKDRDYAF
jgi:hypothetical protein